MAECRREIVSPHWMIRAVGASLPALMLVLTLTACTAFQAQPLSAARGLDSFDARRLDDPELRHFIERALHEPVSPWPPTSWDFARLVLAAEHYQADLAVAQAKLRAAQAAIVTAGARPNPSLACAFRQSRASVPAQDGPDSRTCRADVKRLDQCGC
jgi:outer membrane protein TolC